MAKFIINYKRPEKESAFCSFLEECDTINFYPARCGSPAYIETDTRKTIIVERINYIEDATTGKPLYDRRAAMNAAVKRFCDKYKTEG